MLPSTRLLSPTLSRFMSFGLRNSTGTYRRAVMGATTPVAPVAPAPATPISAAAAAAATPITIPTTTTAAAAATIKPFKTPAMDTFKNDFLPKIPRVYEVDPIPDYKEIPIYRIPLTEESNVVRETIYKHLHLGLLELRDSILVHTTTTLNKPLVNWPTFCYFLRQERIFGLSPDNIGDDLERLLSPTFIQTKATETHGPYTLVLMNWMKLSGMDYRAWYKLEEMFDRYDCSFRETCGVGAAAGGAGPAGATTAAAAAAAGGGAGAGAGVEMATGQEKADLEMISNGLKQGLLDRGIGNREEVKWMVGEMLKAVERVRTVAMGSE